MLSASAIWSAAVPTPEGPAVTITDSPGGNDDRVCVPPF
jgi:hypothetical protein